MAAADPPAGAAHPPRISACVIAQDEAERLPACLASLAFCDEVVVVDGGSRDATVQLARAAGAIVVENPFPGFARQRNVALDHASGEWILQIDADERVTPALQDELVRFAADPPAGFDAGMVPLRDHFLGGPLGPSAKYPRYRMRVFSRAGYRFDDARLVHEGLWPHDRVWVFAGALDHVLASTLREAWHDAWNYARLDADQLGPASRAAVVRQGVVRPLVKFGYRMVLEGGWRDGWRGAVRIGLDCATDAMIWLRRGRARGPARPLAAAADPAPPRHGSPRIVGVASTARGGRAAAAWLQGAAAAGADVALVAPAPGGPGVRVRPLVRRSLVGLLQALDAEQQVRPIDAVVAFDRGARLGLRPFRAASRGMATPAPGAGAEAVVAEIARGRGRPPERDPGGTVEPA